MASFRNRYMAALQSISFAADYVIIVDADLLGGWSNEGLANTLGYDAWDAVGSNGLYVWRGNFPDGSPRAGIVHFDAWAFRSHDSADPAPAGTVNKLVFRRGDPFIPVMSAFGGLAVYRRDALLSSRYGGGDCEHVTLHREMRSRGYDRVFVNPSQIALYSAHGEYSQFANDPRLQA
jgi:hypothetical protein